MTQIKDVVRGRRDMPPMKIPAPFTTLRLSRRGKGVIAVGLLATAFVVAGSVLMLWHTRETEIAEWKANLYHSSIMLTEHSRQTMKAADLVLKSITDRVQDAGIETEDDLRRVVGTQEIFEILRNKASSVPQIDVASVVAIDGQVINFTRSFPAPPINLADRDYFIAHMADPALEVFLSAPVRNRGTGTWTFYLSRKIKSRSGVTLGLVLTGLESKFFQEFFKAVNISEDSAISLFRSDGILLARYPEREGLIGKSFSEQPVFRDIISRGNEAGAVVTKTPRLADGMTEMRIVAPRSLKDYPLVVNITATDALILALWRSTAAFIGWGTALVALLLLGLTGWIATLLTRQEATVAELRRARIDAEQAGAAKAEFLAMMSHEIRTPMNAVIGMSSLLAESPLAPDQQRSVRVIEDSANHLLTIINEILDFSRLEAGHLDPEQSTFSIRELADSAVQIAQSVPGGTRLAVTTAVDADIPEVLRGDSGQLNQLFLNFLSNAVKYTERGTVVLAVRMIEKREDTCRIRFSVSDTGAGISWEMQSRLFLPFERGDRRMARGKGGTGLGLAICKRIVDLMGGSIGVESAPGKGSTFWFELELELGIAFPEIRAAAVPSKSILAHNLRVLVAEDTPANQLVIRAMLDKLGHRCQIVGDGDEAVAAATAGLFDLILMDVQMPTMDGYEATQRIRALGGASARTPIVALTAFAQPSDRDRALRAGMTDYLRKPIRLSELAAMIDRVVVPGDAEAEVDGEALAELRSAVGVETFEVLRAQFVTDTTESLDDLTVAKHAGDDAKIRAAAHRLSGLFGQFGAPGAADAAQAVEQASGSDIAGLAARLLAVGNAAVDAVRDFDLPGREAA